MNIEVERHEMVAEHAAGIGYRGIGARHGISHEGARRVVMSQATALVNDVEMSLYLAHKLERMGRADEAEWPGLAVPHQPGDGWQLALSLLQLVDRLRQRDVPVQVKTRPLTDGTVFILVIGEAA